MMLDLDALRRAAVHDEPYRWTQVQDLVRPERAGGLEREFPRDRYRVVKGGDGEKTYSYLARGLVRMDGALSDVEALTADWRALAEELAGPALAEAVSEVLDLDVTAVPRECNAMRYGPGDDLGSHTDLPDKLATVVVYLSTGVHGGEFCVLGSADPTDRVAAIEPTTGQAVAFRRSDASWHAVAPVAAGSPWRKNLTLTFYRPGAVSTMWPPGAEFPLVEAPDA